MFFPLVVLVAVLPGLYALTSWDLNPPGPWWGLRGLAVLDGRIVDQVPAVADVKPEHEARAFRAVALQPPLYAWLEAIGLALSPERDPRATVLPSYVGGALVVVLIYLHGRLWHGPGLGLIAAILTGFNRNLLIQMQEATPTTVGLAGMLTALLCYGWHLRAGADARFWGWAGTFSWTVLGGLSLGLALMSLGGIALIGVPVVLLHQAYLRADPPPSGRSGRWWLIWRNSPSLTAAAAALAVGLALAAPWNLQMYATYGVQIFTAALAPQGPPVGRASLLGRLVDLAPATLPLGLYAAARMIRQGLTDETEDDEVVGGVFWILWLAVAALVPTLLPPSGPRPTLGLFLLAPLNLLAALAITDLANRRIPIRTLTWLAPATAVSIAWWASANLRGAVDDLAHARADSATALGLHLALDLIVIAFIITRSLDRWARRRDDRQRQVLGVFLTTVLLVTVAAGAKEVCFHHKETDDLLMLRSMILRRNREQPFDLVAVVSPDPARQSEEGSAPGGRLRFILRSALPHLNQVDLTSTDDLLSLPKGQRLIILAGTGQRLSYAVQSRLGLEAIHPGRSGVLDAFATASVITEKRSR